MRTLKELQQSAKSNGSYLEISNVTQEEITNAVNEGAKFCSNSTHEWLNIHYYTEGCDLPHSWQQLVINK